MSGWSFRNWLSAGIVLLLSSGLVPRTISAQVPSPAPEIQFDAQAFNDRILPILSDSCFQCHGPDALQREADLRLDLHSGLFGRAGEGVVVEPGEPDKSELWKRIASADPDRRMPPPDSGLYLSQEQRDQIRGWIEAGAPWSQHWSFAPIIRPAVPVTAGFESVGNPVDAFVLERLNELGWKPADQAARETLIRRVTLDLTGLPPTVDELQEFLNDSQPGAYERLVDRLLSSPRRGEHLATPWLDAARYADTSGYQSDGPREMWRWRDWVIASFNQNMGFDQFTVEQLAGDLLPRPTLDQLVATGFNRNHRGNAEGGIVPEEFAVEYVVDRVDTTGTVWMGLTLGCARCHDHKYDPISQQDYYRLFAFFNAVPENGRALKEGNSPPFIAAPTDAQARTLAGLRDQEQRLNRQLSAKWKAQQAQFLEWQATAAVVPGTDLRITDATTYWNDFGQSRPEPNPGTGPDSDWRRRESLQLAKQGIKLETDAGKFGYFDSFTISAWVKPGEPTGTIVSRMEPDDHGAGYSIHLEKKHLQVNLVKRWLDDSIRVETKTTLPLDRWTHITVTYDGSRVARGIAVWLNGEAAALRVNLDAINQSFEVDQPLRVGTGISGFRGEIDALAIHSRVLDADEIRINAAPETIDEILATPAEQRSRNANNKLFEYYLAEVSDRAFRELRANWLAARQSRTAFEKSLPTVMLMRDDSTDLTAAVLKRGQYDQPGQQVEAGTPGALPEFPIDQPVNRLGLARWLTSARHPLTARVLVNRLWEFSFGRGLVETSEDFGIQGSRPTHPRLLDWLAAELIHSGWDIRHVQRLIVTSRTYCQVSEFDERDPANLNLARGPRFRLRAESIRDSALAASGLLSERLGGPSVRPYQPEGLWKEIASTTEYEQSTGRDLYRRSLYTYWKRTVAPSTLATFDAGNRETCVIRRPRTNTPLQALALLNDTIFVEAARTLAEHLLLEQPNDSQRFERLYLTVLARKPRDEEVAILSRALQTARSRFNSSPQSAAKLLEIGDSPRSQQVDEVEHASWTYLCNLVLNLDEAVTRP